MLLQDPVLCMFYSHPLAGRLETMIVTLRRVGAEWMAKTALASGFHNTIGKDAAITLFAPTDEVTGKVCVALLSF